MYWAATYFAATYFAPGYFPGATTVVVVTAAADPDETVFELVSTVPVPWETVFVLA